MSNGLSAWRPINYDSRHTKYCTQRLRLSDVAGGHVVEREDRNLKGDFMNEKIEQKQDEAKPEGADAPELINAVVRCLELRI